MTAAPRPTLRALPPADRRSETLVEQWEPQRQFVGALLWQTAASAAPLIDLVPDSAITDPLTRWAYELTADLVAGGRTPAVPSVFTHGRRRPARQALRPDRPPTGRDLQRLGKHLVDLYLDVVDPRAVADHARDVLDEAYRRAVHTHGIRLQHLAETCPSTDELATAVTKTCHEMTALRRPGAGDAH
jgi:hypothetical protein